MTHVLAPNEGEDDVVVLLALVAVDSGHLTGSKMRETREVHLGELPLT